MLNTKHLLVFALCSLLFAPIKAHNSLIGIGLRGGGQMMKPSAPAGSTEEIRGGIGGVGGIDLRYTFYGCFTNRIGMGFVVGAGLGYGSTSLSGTHTDQYTNVDYLGNRIDYTIDSKYRQTDKFLQANASLMLAFCFGNFNVNIGPRFMMPVSPSSQFKIEEAHINAYYPQYDVTVTDKLVTGLLTTPYTQAVPSRLPQYSVLMGAEVGYEWYVTNNTALGVQLFADISVWNKKSTNPLTTNPLIQVNPITDAANPVPVVNVYATSMQHVYKNYIDFGVRAYVAFAVVQDRGYNYHFNSRRDTRKHRNRYLWW